MNANLLTEPNSDNKKDGRVAKKRAKISQEQLDTQNTPKNKGTQYASLPTRLAGASMKALIAGSYQNSGASLECRGGNHPPRTQANNK